MFESYLLMQKVEYISQNREADKQFYFYFFWKKKKNFYQDYTSK